MKRLLHLILVLVLVLAFESFGSFACATDYDTLKTDFAQGGNPTVPKAIVGSGQLYTGPCRILSVNFFSSTAGDYVAIYNTVDPSLPIADLEFEMGIAANNTNATPYRPDAPFDKGIRVQSTNAASVTTVVFDY